MTHTKASTGWMHARP